MVLKPLRYYIAAEVWRHLACTAAFSVGLPVLFALYRNPKDCDRTHPFRTRQQIAAQMIRTVHAALPDRTLRVAADGQYATTEVVAAAAGSASNLVSRLRFDAALYELPPRRQRFKRGRRRKKGRRGRAARAFAGGRGVFFGLPSRLGLNHGITDFLEDQLYGPHRVVIARNGDIDIIRIGVRVDEGAPPILLVVGGRKSLKDRLLIPSLGMLIMIHLMDRSLN